MKNWEARGSEKSTATWVSDENNKRVCTMIPSETDWENCQLIAAAPDLLESLIDMLYGKRDQVKALAAINKAKGL